ncbi:hypothetical protein A0H81_12358 [Grifola frondosa]|uniref:Uncharacterized protein n=1 Tax=Grifola frondosa TaxID=5627 RepID=A0A1C7LUE3_GRIFR|nr:hypothetical protein A0H81_12358 [Grifola frondosa]
MDPPHHHPHRRIPAVPDLRFEYSYLRSIAPYVRVERQILQQTSFSEKGKGKAVETTEREAASEIVQVQWGPLLWITTRDQVISPLLQGTLWAIVSLFLRPWWIALGSDIRSWWARGASRNGSPEIEGHGVQWLRNWMSALLAGSVTGSSNALHVK